jgi:proline iminopeptidase
VWSNKVGNGRLQLLLSHGGPGTSPQIFLQFTENLSPDYTIYSYSQLGTHFSDNPKDDSLYNSESFVEDVEYVRKALNLDQFYILGHSWGNYLAQAYSAKYQKHLSGIILSNNVNAINEILADYSVQLYADIMDEFTAFKTYLD